MMDSRGPSQGTSFGRRGSMLKSHAAMLAVLRAQASASVQQRDIKLRRGKQGYGVSLSTSAGKHSTMNHFVTEVAKGSPSEKAGLLVGDRVLMINGMATYGLTHPEFVTLLAKAGEDGKVVTVTVSSDAQTPSTASESPTPTTVAVFSPGERVSALYLPEEKFYDAVIVSIDRGRQSATVEYIGYGDRAEVPLNLINPATNRNEDDKAKRATADPQDAEHPDEPDLPPFWVAKEIGERERYFFNTLTNETSWEHPGLKGTANELDNIDTANFEMTAQGDEGVAVSGPPAAFVLVVAPEDEEPYEIDGGPASFGGSLTKTIVAPLFYDVHNPTADPAQPLFQGVPPNSGLIVEKGGVSEVWEKVLRCQKAGAAFVIVVNNETSEEFLKLPAPVDADGEPMPTNIGVPVTTISLVDAFDLLASLQEGVPVKCQIDPTPSHSVINHPYVTVGVDNTSAPLGLQLTPATCKGVFLTGVKPDSAAAASAGLAAAYPDHSGSSHEVWTKQVVNINGGDVNWDATDNDVEQLLNGSSSKVWLTLDLSTEHPGQLYKVPMNDLSTLTVADAESARRVEVSLPNGFRGFGNVHFVGYHHITDTPRVGVVLDDPYGRLHQELAPLPPHVCGNNRSESDGDDPLGATGGLVACGDYFTEALTAPSLDPADPSAVAPTELAEHGLLTLEEYVFPVAKPVELGELPEVLTTGTMSDAPPFATSDLGSRVRVTMPSGWSGLGNVGFVGTHALTGAARVGVWLDDPYGEETGAAVLPAERVRTLSVDDPTACTMGKVGGTEYLVAPAHGGDGQPDPHHGVLTEPSHVAAAPVETPAAPVADEPEAEEEEEAAPAKPKPLVVKLPADPTKKVGLGMTQTKHGLYISKVTAGGRAAAIVDKAGTSKIKVGCRLVKVGTTDVRRMSKKQAIEVIKGETDTLVMELIGVRRVVLDYKADEKLGFKFEQNERLQTKITSVTSSPKRAAHGKVFSGDILVAINDEEAAGMDKEALSALLDLGRTQGTLALTFLDQGTPAKKKSAKKKKSPAKAPGSSITIKARTAGGGWRPVTIEAEPSWPLEKLQAAAIKQLGPQSEPLTFQGWALDGGQGSIPLDNLGIVHGATLYFSGGSGVVPPTEDLTPPAPVRVCSLTDGELTEHTFDVVLGSTTVRQLKKQARRVNPAVTKESIMSYQGFPLSEEAKLDEIGLVAGSSVYAALPPRPPSPEAPILPTLRLRIRRGPTDEWVDFAVTAELGWTVANVKAEVRRLEPSSAELSDSEIEVTYDGGAAIAGDHLTLADVGLADGATLLCTAHPPTSSLDLTTSTGPDEVVGVPKFTVEGPDGEIWVHEEGSDGTSDLGTAVIVSLPATETDPAFTARGTLSFIGRHHALSRGFLDPENEAYLGVTLDDAVAGGYPVTHGGYLRENCDHNDPCASLDPTTKHRHCVYFTSEDDRGILVPVGCVERVEKRAPSPVPRIREMVPTSDVSPFTLEEHLVVSSPTRVKVRIADELVDGTLRWMGRHHETGDGMIGVELDEFRGENNGRIKTETTDYVYFEPCEDFKGVIVPPSEVQPDFETMSRVDLTVYLQRKGVDYSQAFTVEDLRALARGDEVEIYNPFEVSPNRSMSKQESASSLKSELSQHSDEVQIGKVALPVLGRRPSISRLRNVGRLPGEEYFVRVRRHGIEPWGLRLKAAEGRVVVTGVDESDCPAAESADELPVGTIVIEINDRDTQDMTQVDVSGILTDTTILELKMSVAQPGEDVDAVAAAHHAHHQAAMASTHDDEPTATASPPQLDEPPQPEQEPDRAHEPPSQSSNPFAFAMEAAPVAAESVDAAPATVEANPFASSNPFEAATEQPEPTAMAEPAPGAEDQYDGMGRLAIIKLLRTRSVDYSHCTDVDELRALARETDPDTPPPAADAALDTQIEASVAAPEAEPAAAPESTRTELPSGNVRLEMHRASLDSPWGLKIGKNRGHGVFLMEATPGSPFGSVAANSVNWTFVEINGADCTDLDKKEVGLLLKSMTDVTVELQPPREPKPEVTPTPAQEVTSESASEVTPEAQSAEPVVEDPPLYAALENSVRHLPNGDVELTLYKDPEAVWGLKMKESSGGGLSFKKAPAPDSVAAWGGHIREGGRLVAVNGLDATSWGKEELKPHVMGQNEVVLVVSYAHEFYTPQELAGGEPEESQYDNIDHGDEDGAPTIAPPEPPARSRDSVGDPVGAPPPPPSDAAGEPSVPPPAPPAAAVDVDSMKKLQCIKLLRQHGVDYSNATTIDEIRDLVRAALGIAPADPSTAEDEYALPVIKNATQAPSDAKAAAAAEEEEELYEMPERASDRQARIAAEAAAADAAAAEATADAALAGEEGGDTSDSVYGEPISAAAPAAEGLGAGNLLEARANLDMEAAQQRLDAIPFDFSFGN